MPGWVGCLSPFFFLFNGFNPQFERKVLTLRIAELPAQFLLISLGQHFQIERNRSGQVFHVVAIPLNVAL
jgi:hypothetical protein